MATIYLVVVQMGSASLAPVKAFADRDVANANRDSLNSIHGGSTTTSRSYMVIPVEQNGIPREQSIVAVLLLLGLLVMAITGVYRMAFDEVWVGDIIALALAVLVTCYLTSFAIYRRKKGNE